MNEAGYALLILCALAGLADTETRVYYGSFGLLMLGHYFATWPLPVEDFDYAYFSSAALCVFLVLMLPRKTKKFLFLSLVCGACVATNFTGWTAWSASKAGNLDASLYTIYDSLYLGIYCVVILYLIPKALHGRINQALGAARNFFRAIAYHSSRHMGARK